MLSSPSLFAPCGAVFTPLSMAEGLVARFGLAKAWKDGATMMDPTCGDGVWFQALVNVAATLRWKPGKTDFARLFGVEKEPLFLETFYRRARSQGWRLRERNFRLGDFLLQEEGTPRVDFGIGNPPWASFADLPDDEKERLKPLYRRYDLIYDARAALGGASRVDLAALVTAKFLRDHLNPGGRTVFLLPRSLAISAAHEAFRRFYPGTGWERLPNRSFPGVGTAASLGWWGAFPSSPSGPPPSDSGPEPHPGFETAFEPIVVPESSKPRQGINTQGANSIFFFKGIEPDFVEKELLYPVPVTDQWKGESIPSRWVLLPHDPATGRPYEARVLQERFPRAWRYLRGHEKTLQERRGALIRKLVEKGFWYALWGVGPYTFAPWKLVWPAYGESRFHPLVLGPGPVSASPETPLRPWIPHQALQAYCGFFDETSARVAFEGLKALPVERFLLEAEGAGTPGWAQPGKMQRFFRTRS